MANEKSGTNIFSIMYKSLMIYLKNFLPLSRVMLFPAFGTAIGGLLSVGLPLTYNALYTQKFLKSAQGNPPMIIMYILLMILLMLPGLAIFIKAFWEYMIVFVSTNTMVWDIEKTGSFQDFKAHNNAVKSRTKDYLKFLLLTTLFFLLPFILIIASLLATFIGMPKVLYFISCFVVIIIEFILITKLSLIYQIFAFETLSTMEIIKKSWNMIKGNFWRTVFMGTVLVLIPSLIIPMLCEIILMKTHIMAYILSPFQSPDTKTPLLLFSNFSTNIFGQFITMMLLPLGSACFTLLYFDIIERNNPKVLISEPQPQDNKE